MRQLICARVQLPISDTLAIADYCCRIRMRFCDGGELPMHARGGRCIAIAFVPGVQHLFEIFVIEQREKRDTRIWISGDSVEQDFEVTREARNCLGLKESSVVLELQMNLRGWINYQHEIKTRNSRIKFEVPNLE